MEQTMKKIGLQMSLLMGLSLSFCLSIVGNLQAEKFSVVGCLISFLVSFLISMIIGFIIPIKKVGDAAVGKAGLRPESIPARLLESLISDLIYTPIITVIMVIFAYKQATAHGAQIPFVPMLIKSLIISLIVGYVLIFILMPLFLKLLMGKAGITPGGPAGRPGGPEEQ